jgi:hypothetical protein
MHRAPTPFLRAGFASLLLLPLAMRAGGPAANQPARPSTESSTGQWVFSLLPKSFQDNPFVDQTMITEMTEDGRKLPTPSTENPAYYAAQAMGYHTEGHATAAEQPPPQASVESSLWRALAGNGYLPAAPGHPPTLLIIYAWGVHNNLDQGSDEVGGAFVDVGHKNLLSRAILVGGTRFAAELKDALQKHDLQRESPVTDVLDPLKLFVERDPKTRQLFEQSKAACYFVVASVYDYQAGIRGERKLLWRSKMTVDAAGVSMADTLPTLILNAGKYLGRDMPESATFTQPINRNGQVNLGPMEVKEYMDKSAPPKPETKP